MRVGIVVRKNSCQLLNNPPLKYLFKGITAYVEVRTNQEDRSSCVSSRLKSMGAKTRKRLSSNCTHLVFKDGSFSTYHKAKQLGLHIVSVSWIEASRKEGSRLEENDFPCCNRKHYEQTEYLENIRILGKNEVKTRPIINKSHISSPNKKQKSNKSNSGNKKIVNIDKPEGYFTSKKEETGCINPKLVKKYPNLLSTDSLPHQKDNNSPKRSARDVYDYDSAIEDFSPTPKFKYAKQFSSPGSEDKENGPSSTEDLSPPPKYESTKQFSNIGLKDKENGRSTSEDLLPPSKYKSTKPFPNTGLEDKENAYFTSEYNNGSICDKTKGYFTGTDYISNTAPPLNIADPCKTELVKTILKEDFPSEKIDTKPMGHCDGISKDEKQNRCSSTFDLTTSDSNTNRKINPKEADLTHKYENMLNIINECFKKTNRLKNDDSTSHQGDLISKETIKKPTSGNIVKDIQSICLKILNKPPNYDTSIIIKESMRALNRRKSQASGNVEAKIISNCAKILGYTVK